MMMELLDSQQYQIWWEANFYYATVLVGMCACYVQEHYITRIYMHLQRR